MLTQGNGALSSALNSPILVLSASGLGTALQDRQGNFGVDITLKGPSIRNLANLKMHLT
jgi:hypothetical protein